MHFVALITNQKNTALTALSSLSTKVVMLLKYTMQCFSVNVVEAFGRLLRTPHIGNSPDTFWGWKR